MALVVVVLMIMAALSHLRVSSGWVNRLHEAQDKLGEGGNNSKSVYVDCMLDPFTWSGHFRPSQ